MRSLDELEKLTRSVWGAYEYLRANDLSAESGTSKRLRAGDREKLRARLIEELYELRGVVEGTHFHEGFDQDIVLEGYEVWYWAACLAIASGLSYEAVGAHRALLVGYEAGVSSRESLLPSFDKMISKLTSTSPGDAANLSEVLRVVGQACRLNDTPPARLLERDRAEMSEKEYLTPYWQSLQAS